MLFRMLGSLRATANGNDADLGGHKQRVVLAGLLLHSNRVVSADQLIEWVWGEQAPRTAAHSIQIYVSELRKALRPLGADDLIVTQEPGYLLAVPQDEVDVGLFESLIAAAAESLRDGRPDAAADDARQALALWEGPPLSDFAYDEFAQSEIRRLEERHLIAEELLAESELAAGRPQKALDRLPRLIGAHPLRESLSGLLMEALYRVGRSADALGEYQRLRHRLGDELGVAPSPHLQDLEDRILIQDPSLGQQATVAGTSRNPYKGLRPFEEADAGDFFGRTALVEELISRLAAGTRFLSLVGPSGAGKSSAVGAGLIPALRAGKVADAAGWACVVMTPGPHPFTALVAALQEAVPPSVQLPDDSSPDDPRSVLRILSACAAGGTDVLLFLDQFEELFTLGDKAWAEEAFLGLLAEAVADPDGALRLITTLRGDFYDRPLLHPRFGELFGPSVVSVMPLTPSELGEAVAGPAHLSGVAAEPQLIAALVADVAGRSGALPLFQYTLTELFDRRTSDVLTLDDYRSCGGLEGALVGRAEAVYETLTTSQQEAIRQVMLRMVQAGPEADIARRRVPVRELSSLPIDPLDLQQALDRFGGVRLLSFDRTAGGSPTVEIAHEALLDTWGRLHEWIEASRSDLRRHTALAAGVDTWLEASEDGDYLPTGTQLAELERWMASTDLSFTDGELRYVEAARRGRDRAQEDAETVAETTRRLARRARVRLVGLVVLITAILAVAVVALVVAAGDDEPRVAFVYGGRGDQAFGDLEAAGWDRALRELDFEGEEIIPIADSLDEIVSAAEAEADLVISGGILHTGIDAAALVYPDTAFVQLDMVVDRPNVTSYVFAQDQGSYLAGAAAALESTTGIVGFIGGMDIPIINEFRAGFEAGALATDPAITVLATYVPATVSTPFARPDLGVEAGHLLMEQGADVLYAAAGITAWGALDAVVDRSAADGTHRWFIGADVDQYLVADDRQRPHILTSMLKRVDIALHRAISEFVAGDLDAGTEVLGVADGGVSLATSGGFLDRHQAALDAATGALAVRTPEIPVATGPVIEIAPEANPETEVTVTFDGTTCDFVGLGAITLDEPFALVITNASAGDAFVGFIPVLDETLTFEDLEQNAVAGSADDVPDHLDIFRAQGAAGPPGIRSVIATLDAGHWGAFCTTSSDEGNVAIPAALIVLG